MCGPCARFGRLVRVNCGVHSLANAHPGLQPARTVTLCCMLVAVTAPRTTISFANNAGRSGIPSVFARQNQSCALMDSNLTLWLRAPSFLSSIWSLHVPRGRRFSAVFSLLDELFLGSRTPRLGSVNDSNSPQKLGGSVLLVLISGRQRLTTGGWDLYWTMDSRYYATTKNA